MFNISCGLPSNPPPVYQYHRVTDNSYLTPHFNPAVYRRSGCQKWTINNRDQLKDYKFVSLINLTQTISNYITFFPNH